MKISTFKLKYVKSRSNKKWKWKWKEMKVEVTARSEKMGMLKITCRAKGN